MGELLHSVGGARFLRSKEIGFNYDKKMGFGAMLIILGCTKINLKVNLRTFEAIDPSRFQI